MNEYTCETDHCHNPAIWRVTLYGDHQEYSCDCHLDPLIANERFTLYRQGIKAYSGSVGGYAWNYLHPERLANGNINRRGR